MSNRTDEVSYESKVNRAIQKINEKPSKFLNKIGSFLTSETKRKQKRKSGRLRKGTQYWARKRSKDLLIGSKTFYSPAWEKGNKNMRAEPAFLPTVEENIGTIQRMVKASYSELNKD